MSNLSAAFESLAPRKKGAPAVILFSGGLDSTTVLALAKDLGYTPYALSVGYGQRHSSELAAAKHIAKQIGVARHEVVNLDLTRFGGSALTDSSIAVPITPGKDQEIPITYVPARNTILLSLALGWAESLGGLDVFYGANAVDYSGYPDCRPEYVASFEHMANLATKAGVEAINDANRFRVHAPIISLTKAEIIQLGSTLGVDYSQTVSCYQANDLGEACGECESCRLRQAGFKQANVSDPTRYQKKY
ncbi:7-cyano-7-deazaguanine synthase QueC [Polynucleobacter sp. JS-Safj-400b-B2]|uniref:7-cyano-7-deazaguanine synthase QueC n=1 Tax=Polynucleobacter sp. JS-Safj-400b-B2 TaxID=2576921 RepID=UPI001C0B7694|nr:7-cyano-7-deazaguanine synthase QueC [Polynucleobacter sp. JS-Safj-400b-B2]MBU3625088.1 7-cyano-7-deazaguanine synthase QueC [Polynucleobacter sp. JS-Safj-400b-B2]